MVESIKDLDKLLKLLRKQGVTTFECKDLKLALGPEPKKYRAAEADAEDAEEYAEDEIDKLVGMPVNPTDDQLIEWNLTGSMPASKVETDQ